MQGLKKVRYPSSLLKSCFVLFSRVICSLSEYFTIYYDFALRLMTVTAYRHLIGVL